MSHWNNREFTSFVEFVARNYNRSNSNVAHFIDLEYKALLEHYNGVKTAKYKADCLELAIENCKDWLHWGVGNKGKAITIDDIESYRISKVYFNAIGAE